MAYYAIAPLMCVLPLIQNELCMHLFLHQAWGGPTKNQYAVVIPPDSPNGFGGTAANDWVITDGLDASRSNTVGRGQGFTINNSLSKFSFYTSFNLVFENGRFNGSTLQITGVLPQSANGEWSITGGTGELALARGIAKFKAVQMSSLSNVYELTLHAYYSPMDSCGNPVATCCESWKVGTTQDGITV
nr:dirigent protein 2 [Oryza sativa Japonica Group]